MNKLAQLWSNASHPRELRLALSGLGARLAGDDAMGGLSADETAAVCRWASRRSSSPAACPSRTTSTTA